MTLTQVLKLTIIDNADAQLPVLVNLEDTDNARVITLDEYQHVNIQVADATTDLLINFGGVATANFIYIKTDQTITYKLNGTGNLAISATKNAPTFLNTASITSLHISNASGSAANMQIIIAILT